MHLLFNQFWAKSLGLSTEAIANTTSQVSYSGGYVDCYGDEYIYIFEDLRSRKRVLVGTKKNISPSVEKSFNGGEDSFQGFELAFNDIDYCFSSWDDFRSHSCQSRILELTRKSLDKIEEFYKTISEDDKDTLDLTFEGEYILGIYDTDLEGKQKLAGIARYGALKSHPKIVDITVVISQNSRGKGFGLQLVSALFEKIKAADLVPRYRVNEDLHGSISIARKLGMTPHYSVQTYRRSLEIV